MGGRSSQQRKAENHTIWVNEWDGSIFRVDIQRVFMSSGGNSATVQFTLTSAAGKPLANVIVLPVSSDVSVATVPGPVASDVNGQGDILVTSVNAGVADIALSYPNDNNGAGRIVVTVV